MKTNAFLRPLLFASIPFVAALITYERIDEGEINGRGFQRFAAIDATLRQALTAEDWSDALLAGDVASLNLLFRDIPYGAFYFEAMPVTSSVASSQPFEFVLLDAPALAKRNPRFRSFEKHCQSATEQDTHGCVFSNLSGDATLIVPKPHKEQANETYPHLANFVRHGPEDQVEGLWKLVAKAYRNAWGNSNRSTVWLSTAGNGVPWLHFRLDSNPKYYRYKPFKQPTLCNPNTEF